MNDMKELFIQYKGILKDLLRYGVLKTEALEHTGLYNGKLGMTILFYEYSRYSGDALYEQFADEILESIMELPDDLSLDLSDGLYSPYKESYIQKKIWETCFSQNQLEMNQ